MFKKIVSLALVAMLLMSVAVVGFSAAQVEVVEEAAAADVADQGAENDDAATGALDTSTCLNFDVSTTGWSDFGSVGFYVWAVGGDELIAWGSKKLFKSEETSTGVWSYDPSANGMDLQDGTQYCIIFVNENSGAQTYNLMFDTSCIGDTAYADPNTMYENPTDSNKTAMAAYWKNSSYGPQLCISSIGTVQGTTCPSTTTPYQLFVDFLKDTLANARTYSNKDDQTLLDDTAKTLKLGKNDVEKAIGEAGVTTEWSKDKSSLDDESDASANQAGSAAAGGSNNNTSSSSSTGGTSTNKSTGTTTSSKSGAASNTQTGQTETVLFIMLGVMVAAAGVIFFARKKERA